MGETLADAGVRRPHDQRLDESCGATDDRITMNSFSLLRILTCLFMTLALTQSATAVVWQWSVEQGTARAYLWIPPDCSRVRGVVIGNHNMIEQGIFEHPAMRKTLGDLGFAEVWVVPKLDHVFDPAGDAGARFQKLMDDLATESGYTELSTAPVVPIGHSANATWPWNFAAWNPGRTLAVLSIKGDAPRTHLTGYGGKNPDWGSRSLMGVPGLMVIGEYEFAEDRLAPMFAFKRDHPDTPVTLLCDAGRGHFDASDELIELLALFICKSADARLPRGLDAGNDVPALRTVDPGKGWLMDRWRRDEKPRSAAAPFVDYAGDRGQALWVFDEAVANAVEAHHVKSRGKRPQLLGVLQNDRLLPQTQSHEQVRAKFEPTDDGMTFKLAATFLDVVPDGSSNPSKWAGIPIGSPIGHADGGGMAALSRIVGPVEQLDSQTFRLRFGRAEFTQDRRNNDLWLLASHPGHNAYKSAVQQLMVRADPNKAGKPQKIIFPAIDGAKPDERTIKLSAISDSGLPVQYYVREGPAEVDGDTLTLAPIPPRAKFPMRITVVAWQWGRPGEDGVQTAEPVTRSFRLTDIEH